MTRLERFILYALVALILGLLTMQPRTRINFYDCQGVTPREIVDVGTR